VKTRALVVAVIAVIGFAVASCSGDDDDDPADTPSPTTAAQAATTTPTRAAEATTSPPTPTTVVATTVTTNVPASPTPGSVPPRATPAFIENGDVTGTFLEPGLTVVTEMATLGVPTPPVFDAWDRQTVVLYDLQNGTATNYGPGFFAGFSSDGAVFGYNNAGVLTVVDIASGNQQTFPAQGGLASMVGEHYAVLPAGPGTLLDFETGVQTPVASVDDPELRYLAEQRLRPVGSMLMDGGLVLRHTDWPNAPCADDASKQGARCQAELFEQWAVTDPATGDDVLTFRAIAAAPAGPGTIVIATSPQCATSSGGTAWCEEVLAAIRQSTPPTSTTPQYGEGTTNLFLVDIETGEATFVATATYNPHAQIWPMNWPLIADEDYVIWTESFCGQPQGKTRIFERSSREITELDVSPFVKWQGDGVGIGEFGSTAVFDPATLDYVAVAPGGIGVDFRWSPDLRYVGVGAVLGHGGLCG
jgi:hypothetical protein